jgi:hypothetical protein
MTKPVFKLRHQLRLARRRDRQDQTPGRRPSSELAPEAARQNSNPPIAPAWRDRPNSIVTHATKPPEHPALCSTCPCYPFVTTDAPMLATSSSRDKQLLVLVHFRFDVYAPNAQCNDIVACTQLPRLVAYREAVAGTNDASSAIGPIGGSRSLDSEIRTPFYVLGPRARRTWGEPNRTRIYRRPKWGLAV